MIAGPMHTMYTAGNTHSASGKISFTPTFAALLLGALTPLGPQIRPRGCAAPRHARAEPIGLG
jgi:hypothetical protein